MSYVEGVVLAVPAAGKDAYLAYAERVWEVYRDHGALAVGECWGDELPGGKATSFPKAVRKREDETVVFAWIEWPDRAARDRCLASPEAEARMKALGPMPLDGRRMIHGGFVPLLVRRA